MIPPSLPFCLLLSGYSALKNWKLLLLCVLLLQIPGTLHKMVSDKLVAMQQGRDSNLNTGNHYFSSTLVTLIRS